MIILSNKKKTVKGIIHLPASKSISNRLLLIQYMMKRSFEIRHLSSCDDTRHLVRALNALKQSTGSIAEDAPYTRIDVGEAGTSYRFLTALLSHVPGKFELVGSERLMERPIWPLAESLISLGADIKAATSQGNGPLYIHGKKLKGGQVKLKAHISSQFISALMLIAPYFTDGLTIELEGEIISKSYIELSVKLMQEFGAQVQFENNIIIIKPVPYQYSFPYYEVESDWTAASYWYAFAALSKAPEITLKGLRQNSIQGDSIIAQLFTLYGVSSSFASDGVRLIKKQNRGFLAGYDFKNEPDLVQTFVFLNCCLSRYIQINGASTLHEKESNRIHALIQETANIGSSSTLYDYDSFFVSCTNARLKPDVFFKTYKDHRMAMAASLCALIFDEIKIEKGDVVSKSYPEFWDHLTQAGFRVEQK